MDVSLKSKIFNIFSVSFFLSRSPMSLALPSCFFLLFPSSLRVSGFSRSDISFNQLLLPRTLPDIHEKIVVCPADIFSDRGPKFLSSPANQKTDCVLENLLSQKFLTAPSARSCRACPAHPQGKIATQFFERATKRSVLMGRNLLRSQKHIDPSFLRGFSWKPFRHKIFKCNIQLMDVNAQWRPWRGRVLRRDKLQVVAGLGAEKAVQQTQGVLQFVVVPVVRPTRRCTRRRGRISNQCTNTAQPLMQVATKATKRKEVKREARKREKNGGT